jgi:hypothetical protein
MQKEWEKRVGRGEWRESGSGSGAGVEIEVKVDVGMGVGERALYRVCALKQVSPHAFDRIIVRNFAHQSS